MNKTRVCGEVSKSRSPLTVSTSLTETVNGFHEFKISGYSLTKGVGVGKYVASDTFTVGGHSWAIYFYPDGKSPEDNSSHVSLFIALASEGADVRALFELTLVDQSGNEKHKVHSHFGRALESGPYTLKYRGSMGYKRFFRRDSLETSDYLKDNCLLVRCRVGVVKSCTEGPRDYNISVPVSNLGQQLGSLLESGKGCDVTFEVDGETFSAHKLVLATRSPVFRAQLFGPLRDRDTDRIEIEDVEAPIFKIIYSLKGLIGRDRFLGSLPFFGMCLSRMYHPGSSPVTLLLLNLLTRDKVLSFFLSACLPAWLHECLFLLFLSDVSVWFRQMSKLSIWLLVRLAAMIAVMQTDGFDYLKRSCPSLLTELLKYLARLREHSVTAPGHPKDIVADGCDANGRRVKQRLH
ncbi:hypothetical protein IGI04_009526 [Brassica rapa subsp. trilocularis]|uniref:BTB domain-containing protein n=1 Tax=Brassica rapa subsp. trilocularis TaxID=1813537 RepID=A0ABQ7MXI5_BRACM|nr:hypothetical protein IGI04_009526 [Brassica rapa subsp. trilocularis]